MDPLEFFVPRSDVANPIKYKKTEYLDSTNTLNLSRTGRSILYHETTVESAKSIVRNGFDSDDKEMSPLRDGAVFGWYRPEDVGMYQEETNEDCRTTVLFEVPEDSLYVSSYSTSAYLLAMGDISPEEYEKKHVMRYDDFVSLILNRRSCISHLNYTEDDFL